MAEEIIDLTSSLYRLVQASEELQQSLRKLSAAQVREELQGRAQQLSQRFLASRERAGEKMGHTIDEVVKSLKEFREELSARHPRLERVRSRWKNLGANYEVLVAQIKERRLRIPDGVQLEHLKPRNLYRNVFHVCMGLTGVTCYELWLDRTGAIYACAGFLGFFILLEIARRSSTWFNEQLVDKLLGKISRPHESHQVPAATWYAVAILIGVLAFPKHAIELGLLVLAIGDPVASLVGKTWGKKKIFREKSVAGALGFIGSASLLSFAFLKVVVGLTVLSSLGVAVAVSVVGAIAEIYSHRLDDNFTVPLAVGAMATLLL